MPTSMLRISILGQYIGDEVLCLNHFEKWFKHKCILKYYMSHHAEIL
jgi:hypothetical protein